MYNLDLHFSHVCILTAHVQSHCRAYQECNWYAVTAEMGSYIDNSKSFSKDYLLISDFSVCYHAFVY